MATPTVKQIAKLAGVHHSTVSRVLRGEQKGHWASGKARAARIRRIARELGYNPNAYASRLASRETRTLGLVLRSTNEGAYGQLVDYLYREAEARSYQLQIVLSETDVQREATAISQCLTVRVEGLIVVSNQGDLTQLSEDHPLRHVVRQQVPCIFMSRAIKGLATNQRQASFDVSAATYTCAQHLLTRGYKQLRLIHTEGESFGGEQRRLAFNQALMDAKIKPSPDWELTRRPQFDSDWRVNMPDDQQPPRYLDYHSLTGLGMALAQEALATWDGCTPMGLLCHNDCVALGAWQYCRARGAAVPGRIGITGIDDTHGNDTGLTSVRWDYPALARQLVDMLLALKDGQPADHICIGGALIERSSTHGEAGTQLYQRRIPLHQPSE